MLSEIMKHLHPIVVHFPIALILVATILDIVTAIWKRSIAPGKGLLIWLFAAIGAAVAVATGPDEDARGVTTLIYTHSRFADLTMMVTFLVVLIRLFLWWRKREKMTGFVLGSYLLVAAVATGLVLTTGYYGGEMVYDQGIGVSKDGKMVNPPKAFHRGQHGQPGQGQEQGQGK